MKKGFLKKLAGALAVIQVFGFCLPVYAGDTAKLEGWQIKGKEFKIPKWIDLEYSFYPQEHTEVAEYIKNTLNPDFDVKDYRVTYIDHSDHDDGTDGYIIFDYMIGEYLTDISYMCIASGGRIGKISVLGTPVEKQIPEPRDLPSEEELKQMALDYHDLSSDRYVVEEQTVTKIYETYTGKAYFSVATEYKTPYDDYIRLRYEYPISQSEPVNDFMMDSI